MQSAIMCAFVTSPPVSLRSVREHCFFNKYFHVISSILFPAFLRDFWTCTFITVSNSLCSNQNGSASILRKYVAKNAHLRSAPNRAFLLFVFSACAWISTTMCTSASIQKCGRSSSISTSANVFSSIDPVPCLRISNWFTAWSLAKLLANGLRRSLLRIEATHYMWSQYAMFTSSMDWNTLAWFRTLLIPTTPSTISPRHSSYSPL